MKAAKVLLGLTVGLASGIGASAQESGSAPQKVSVAKVQMITPANSSRYVGRVEATNSVDIVARVEGYLTERKFTEGGSVKQGDLLYVIEKDLYQASVD